MLTSVIHEPGVDMVLDWIISYFSPKLPMNTSTNALDALRGASPVISTEYMPIVLQHAGHSRTIIGYEVSKSGAINLLTFDPGLCVHLLYSYLRYLYFGTVILTGSCEAWLLRPSLNLCNISIHRTVAQNVLAQISSHSSWVTTTLSASVSRKLGRELKPPRCQRVIRPKERELTGMSPRIY